MAAAGFLPVDDEPVSCGFIAWTGREGLDVFALAAGALDGDLNDVGPVEVGFFVGAGFTSSTDGLEEAGSSTGSDFGGSARVLGSVGGEAGCEGGGVGRIQDGAGDWDSVTAGFGGHSRFSFASSLTESPVIFEITLVLRERDIDCRLVSILVCCSKRPMRFATLCRGRSSGNGLRQSLAIAFSCWGCLLTLFCDLWFNGSGRKESLK